MRRLHECRAPLVNLAYDKRKHPRKRSKRVSPELLGAQHFAPLLFVFLEGAEAGPILAFDELFDALILPRAAL